MIHWYYMATTKKRLNISLSPETELIIRKLSERDETPQATKISQLLDLALELEEDRIWDKLASERSDNKPKYFSHEDAWK